MNTQASKQAKVAIGMMVVSITAACIILQVSNETKTEAIHPVIEQKLGHNTAKYVARVHCNKDVYSVLTNKDHVWQDSWCAEHYGHLEGK